MQKQKNATREQGKAADAAGIQFRMLNASKGPAVRGPRAQMDRQLYKQEMQHLLAAVPGLEIVDGAVTNVLLEERRRNISARGQSPAERAIAGVMLASGELATQDVISDIGCPARMLYFPTCLV